MFHVKHSEKFFRKNNVSRETLNAKKIISARKKQANKTIKSKKPDKYHIDCP